MSKRSDEIDKKFIYTDTNPENIVVAKKNAMFYRRGNEFYVNHNGVVNGKWEKLPYKTVIIPHPPKSKVIKYKKEQELWVKTTDGLLDEFGDLLPDTGWKFLSNQNIFAAAPTVAFSIKNLNWIFPVPTSSNDTAGNNNSRSYDENYFYAKISNKWVRTPITIFNYAGNSTSDNANLNNFLPFVAPPRFLPVPATSATIDDAVIGDQTYDADFFYIKPSVSKRSILNVYYNSNKMTRF
jgi:hypothetical protein